MNADDTRDTRECGGEQEIAYSDFQGTLALFRVPDSGDLFGAREQDADLTVDRLRRPRVNRTLQESITRANNSIEVERRLNVSKQ